jgi:chromosome partitioning protein
MPSTRIITVASQKGGTGKTTTAINLGAWLALMEKKVLLVDLDPQANLTMGLGLSFEGQEESTPKWITPASKHPQPRLGSIKMTIYEVLLNPKAGIAHAVLRTLIPQLRCVPSSLQLVGAETDLANFPDKTWRLYQALETCRDEYDFIIIDAPPSLGLFTQNAFLACTEIIVPLQVQYYGLKAMRQLLIAIELMSGYNRALHLSGILCTMYDRRNTLSKVIEETVREQFGKLVFETVIPMNIALAEAPAAGQPVCLYDPLSAGAQAYGRLAQEMMNRD